MNMRGFTLVETLVAITVMTLIIVGPYTLVQRVLQDSYLSRDQLTASALAQEGMEHVRLVRDSNYIYTIHAATEREWLYGLDGTGGPDCITNTCAVDAPASTAVTCSDTTCSTRPLYVTSTGLYTLTSAGNTLTKFTRTVRITNISATEAKVEVTVLWNNHGPRTYTLTEYIRDWL